MACVSSTASCATRWRNRTAQSSIGGCKLARKVLQAGERLVVVSEDEDQRTRLSKVLWEQGGAAFLANGMADSPHAARQPILLSANCDAPNEARMAMIVDGRWRDDNRINKQDENGAWREGR